jgi:hypothetical protein
MMTYDKKLRVTLTNSYLASKTVFLLTFSSLAIARNVIIAVIPSPRRCLIRCFWNSLRFGITADKITVNSDCKSQFYFDFILTIENLIQVQEILSVPVFLCPPTVLWRTKNFGRHCLSIQKKK